MLLRADLSLTCMISRSYFTASFEAYFGYVSGTIDLGLQFMSPSTSTNCYTDADWAGCLLLVGLPRVIVCFLVITFLSWSATMAGYIVCSSAELKHRRALEFQPGEHVFLKVSPTRGVRRFGIKGKLSPRFIGPFEILDRVGEVSYRLALPPQLSHVHNVFHVSLLRGYKYHPLHVISYPFDQIREDLSYTEEPESILDRQDRVMRNKTIPFVKILWRNHPEREATWETEESIRTSYPYFLP
ncbi:putative nucleotidyltransferase, ribonuclease H [Tanacetum coccineum]